ncbi:MAG: DUF3737 family protein [Bacillota bacterium]|nr:DUF3737 family protein [Bacillota bacterium]
MEYIRNKQFDEERALYGKEDIVVEDCSLDGPADGESAFKEAKNVTVRNTFLNLRYPFWHDEVLKIEDCEMTENCRASLWYSNHIEIENTKMHGIKAVRECSDVTVRNCDIVSPEFGWSVDGITMEDSKVDSVYFMMRSKNITFKNVDFTGKYSFQYIENAVFENCIFDTKDAFWHGKDIVVKDSVVKGEYLAWYSNNLTFINCKIIGTQPLCYCENLKLIHCEMIDTDLAFEKSQVQATICSHVDSIKNPLEGIICVPSVGEIIRDEAWAKGSIVIGHEINS